MVRRAARRPFAQVVAEPALVVGQIAAIFAQLLPVAMFLATGIVKLVFILVQLAEVLLDLGRIARSQIAIELVLVAAHFLPVLVDGLGIGSQVLPVLMQIVKVVVDAMNVVLHRVRIGRSLLTRMIGGLRHGSNSETAYKSKNAMHVHGSLLRKEAGCRHGPNE